MKPKDAPRWTVRGALALWLLASPGGLWAQSARDQLRTLAGAAADDASGLPAVARAPQASPCGAEACGGSKYGVIVNGDTEERHQDNADAVFRFMQSYYHIRPEHILFLSTRRGEGGVQMPATGDSLLAAARRLAREVGPQDDLVVYTTGHGARDERTGTTYLALADEKVLRSRDFAKIFLANKAAHTVYFGDQCDSGGFAEAMADTDKKVIAVSSTDDKHSTVCGFFIDPYLKAFEDPANDNDPKDGIVSEWEAFKVAKALSVQGHAAALRSGDLPSDGSTAEEMANGLYLLGRGYKTAAPGAGI